MSLITSGAFSRYPDIKFLFSHAGGTMLSIGLRFQFIKDASGGDSMALLKRSYYDVALSATPLTVPALLSFRGELAGRFRQRLSLCAAASLGGVWRVFGEARHGTPRRIPSD